MLDQVRTRIRPSAGTSTRGLEAAAPRPGRPATWQYNERYSGRYTWRNCGLPGNSQRGRADWRALSCEESCGTTGWCHRWCPGIARDGTSKRILTAAGPIRDWRPPRWGRESQTPHVSSPQNQVRADNGTWRYSEQSSDTAIIQADSCNHTTPRRLSSARRSCMSTSTPRRRIHAQNGHRPSSGATRGGQYSERYSMQLTIQHAIRRQRGTSDRGGRPQSGSNRHPANRPNWARLPLRSAMWLRGAVPDKHTWAAQGRGAAGDDQARYRLIRMAGDDLV